MGKEADGNAVMTVKLSVSILDDAVLAWEPLAFVECPA